MRNSMLSRLLFGWMCLMLPALLHAQPAGRVAPQFLDPASTWADLLGRYVGRAGVRYADWKRNEGDMDRLRGLRGAMEAAKPSDMDSMTREAFWINLYNVATLEQVLAHYPVASIKDTQEPWEKARYRVEGQELSLNDIERDMLLKRFRDPRIHFALNCASKGCPPLAPQPYAAATLDAQLNHATRAALTDPRWVRLRPKRLEVSQLFDWYKDDFARWGGGVRAFIARFRTRMDARRVQNPANVLSTFDYDWSLNEAP